MKKEDFIVKRFSREQTIIGVGLLVGLVLLLSFFFFAFGQVQQCSSIELCGNGELLVSQFSWLKLVFYLTFLIAGVVWLLTTPWLGGLKERERIILKHIFLLGNKVKNRNQLAETLRKKEDLLKRTHPTQFYRIVNKLIKFGYVSKDSDDHLRITKAGMGFIRTS